MFKKLAKSLREYKLPAILTILFMVGEAVIESLIPTITANYLINEIQKNGENVQLTAILKVGVILVLLAMCSLSFGGAAGFTSARAAAGFSKNLRHDLFTRVQSFSFHNIDKFSTASLVTRLTTDVNYVQMSFMMLIRIAIRSPLMLIFSIIMAARLGGLLSLTFAVIIPVLAFGLIMIAKKARPAFRRVFKKYDRLNESVEENVRGMRVVKGFAREEYEKTRFGKAADGICEDFTKAERIVSLNNPLMNFCMYFNMAAILLLGSYLAIARPESGVMIGQMSALITYGVQVLMSLMMLSMIYVTLTISAESARRICEVLDEVPDMEVAKDPVTEVKDGSIVFEGVNFKYAKDAAVNTLSDIDLSIASGMTVGILGGTGVGKSTLVQLIPRLYDVTEGRILVGGVDVRDYDLETLRNGVAMVLQKNLLFAGTIKENLRWGNPDATDEEIVEACKLAQADEFVKSFPEGYDTHIEQGGTNVSGGQKQRLCIARALLKQPKILILDDSTSAVDTRTDAMIRAGFRSFLPETTKIIIAQRVSSVQDADLILVMDDGRIAAMGDHASLLASNEIYREIYEQQTKGGEEDAENA